MFWCWKAALCDFGRNAQYFKYSHNTWTIFFNVKISIIHQHSALRLLQRKQKTRQLLATKFKDYFSHSVSNITFQQTTHYTGKKLQEQITWNCYFPNKFLGTFYIAACAASNKGTYEYVTKTSLRIRCSTCRHFFRSDLMW